MTINITLSEQGINQAIGQLRTIEQNLRWGLEETIDCLAKDGAEVAQNADGGMATVISYMQDETTGVIDAVGEAPVIAEFGAGDATINNPFENDPPVPVYPGSYSELVGTGEYAEKGYWHFGGKRYYLVEPRKGLWKARQYIIEHAAETAKEVIKL